MEWLRLLVIISVIVLLAIIDHEPIGDINARLGYLESKWKKITLSPFLLKIVPQRDTIGAQYFEYRSKEKEAYLLTVILTFLNMILAFGLIAASVLCYFLTQIDPIVFFFCMGGYALFLTIVILILEVILYFKK